MGQSFSNLYNIVDYTYTTGNTAGNAYVFPNPNINSIDWQQWIPNNQPFGPKSIPGIPGNGGNIPGIPWTQPVPTPGVSPAVVAELNRQIEELRNELLAAQSIMEEMEVLEAELVIRDGEREEDFELRVYYAEQMRDCIERLPDPIALAELKQLVKELVAAAT